MPDGISDDEYLRQSRARFSQYYAWHRAHTTRIASGELAAPPGFPDTTEMFKLDVDALSELLDERMLALARCSQLKDFRDVLARLEHSVRHPYWKQHIAYHRAALQYIGFDDRVAAKEEAHSLADWRSIDSVPILTFLSDLYSDSLGHQEKMDLANRILEGSEETHIHLQYRAYRATQLLMIGDRSGAAAECTHAVEFTRSRDKEGLSIWNMILLARVEALRAEATNSPDCLERSVSHLVHAWAGGGLKPEAQAEVAYDIGSAYIQLGKLESARTYLRTSLRISATPQARASLVEACVMLGDFESARDDVHTLLEQFSEFEVPQQLDVARGVAAWSIGSAETEVVSAALGAVRSMHPRPHPAQESFRLSILNALLEARDQPPDSSTALVRLPQWLLWLAWFSRYFELKPNFMGLGLNLNNVLDHAASAARPEDQ